ncbi:hypothetical protein ACHAXS_006091 [Conticribra weissflogii]
MSGRLVILPKKTYCPWNPSNVERVRRDEWLERERVEKEQRLVEEEDRRRKSRCRNQSDAERQSLTKEHKGHVNLFPEAEEAEKKLFHEGGIKAADKSVEKSDNNGVFPVPLGGDEAKNRKSGKLPFYMRPRDGFSQGNFHSDNYDMVVKNCNDHAIRNGIRTRGSVSGDAVTSKIMADQFHRREDVRKQRMDPMNRFYIDEGIDFSRHENIQSSALYTQQFSERFSSSPAIQQTNHDAKRIPKSEINSIDDCDVTKRRSGHRERHRIEKKATEGRKKESRKDRKGSPNNCNSSVDLLSCSSSCLSLSSPSSRSDDDSSQSRRRSRRLRCKHGESSHRKRSKHRSRSRGRFERRYREENHRSKRNKLCDRKKRGKGKESHSKIEVKK